MSYASLFILKKPDGTPIKTLDSLKPNFDFSGLRDTAMNLLSNVDNSSTTVSSSDSARASGMDIQITPQEIYRWQDEQGIWHYTNSPPAGVQAETMDLQAPTVMTLYREEQNENEEAGNERSNSVSGQNGMQSAESESSLIPARIRQMQESVQQAQEVSEQFQQKLNEQQQILEAL